MKEKLLKLLPSKRKIMQLYFAVLFNANLKGFVTGSIYQGNTKKFCAPGINCYSCPGAIGACPLGTLQGSFKAEHSTIFYVFGILFLYSLMFGRMICGWLCPFGLIQELIYKIKTPKVKKSPITRLLSYFKYAILIFFVLIVPILYAIKDSPLPAFCKYICPAGTLEGGIGLLSNKVNAGKFSLLGPLFTWKFLLMVSILVGCIFIFRLFCRFICPLGALYGLFNKISFFGVKVDQSKCTDCGLCVNHCKVDIKHVGDQECISCGSCVDVCPTDAIVWKGPKIKLKPNETDTSKQKRARNISRGICALLLLGILVGAVVYYWTLPQPTIPNLIEQNQQNDIPEGITAERGNEVGNLCYGYDLPIVNGSGVTDKTIDPSTTGKVTVINFWGTWCSPCVAELPYFEQIAAEYGEDITVIAIHSLALNNTAAGFVGKNYPDSPLLFSIDNNESGAGIGDYYTALGGTNGTYPYTVILDENGIITEIFEDSITYDILKVAVDNAMN